MIGALSKTWHTKPTQSLHRSPLYGLRPTTDRLDIDVTDLITLGHTALSVYDNVALFYTVQEYITKLNPEKLILNVYYPKTVCYM